MNTQPCVPAFITHADLKCKKYIHSCDEICIWFHFKVGGLILQFVPSGLMKLDETIVMKLLLGLQQWSLWLRHCDGIH